MGDNFRDAFARTYRRHHVGAACTRRFGVGGQLSDIDANVRREVNFVHNQKVGFREARTFLARNVLACRRVDHVDCDVGKLG